MVEGVRFWGQSHFPDCLVLRRRGGHGITKMTPPFKRLLRLSLSFSVATVGDGKKYRGLSSERTSL